MTQEVLISALALVGMVYLATKMVLAVFVYWQAAHYAETVTQDDPVVRAQIDAYRAEQERARRNHISDLAEKAGGNPVNLEGEKRMAAETVAHAVGLFAAETIAKEVEARRRFKLGLFAASTSLVSKP